MAGHGKLNILGIVMSSLEERIVSLEEKYSHQDILVNELNFIVAKQDQTIERLIIEIKNLKESNKSLTSKLSIDNLEDEKPPHY